MPNKMLSIIIPSLNETYYLPRVLKSIKEQNYSCEVIVVNAGNYEEIKKIGEDGADGAGACEVKVIDCIVDSHGPAYARNVGAEAAQGDILLFLDADVMLPEAFLADCMYEFEKKGLGIAGVYAIPHSDSRFDRFIWHIYNIGMGIMAKIRPEASGFCLFCKKEVHNIIGGFDKTITYREDADYTTRASRQGQGKYGILKPRILISVRRFRNEGRLKMLGKYICLGIKGMFRTIKEDVGYSFGDYQLYKISKKIYRSSIGTAKKIIEA